MSGKLALGIFDQGVWLLSRLKDPFVTIRGLPLFGDHASYRLSAWPAFQWIDMTGLRAGRYGCAAPRIRPTGSSCLRRRDWPPPALAVISMRLAAVL